MKRLMVVAMLALVGMSAFAQDYLGLQVVPADASKGVGATYLYTDGKMLFSIQEKDDDVSLNAFLIAPKGKTFKASKAHLCTIELCSADGIVVQTVKYYTWVQSKKDRLLFYDDAIFGYHAEHASQESKCACYENQPFSKVDLWNFVCNEDGFVRVKTECKDGEITEEFWCVKHKKQ